MGEQEFAEVSEAQIAVHWQEEGNFHPSARFIAQANMTDPAIYERFRLKPRCAENWRALEQ